MLLGIIVRHGSTDLSPEPEWQSQIPLNELGHAEAKVSAYFIKLKSKKKPEWGISSDLKRTEQTIAHCARILDIPIKKPMPELRAIDQFEDFNVFEQRNDKAFRALFATAKATGKVPLIACHRSNLAFLGKVYGGVTQKIDYREASLAVEGGVLEVSTTHGIVPIFGGIDQNPRSNVYAADGTAVSGFVTVEVNKLPRKCGHCKWYDDGHCDHPVVTADDEIGIMFGYKRNKEGKWKVEKPDCCNHYQHKFVPGPTVSTGTVTEAE